MPSQSEQNGEQAANLVIRQRNVDLDTYENAGTIEILDSHSSVAMSAVSRGSETATGDASFDATTSFGSPLNLGDLDLDAMTSFDQSGSFVVSGTGAQTIGFALTWEIDTDIDGMLTFGSGDSICLGAGHPEQGDGPNLDCTSPVSLGPTSDGLSISGSIINVPVELQSFSID